MVVDAAIQAFAEVSKVSGENVLLAVDIPTQQDLRLVAACA